MPSVEANGYDAKAVTDLYNPLQLERMLQSIEPARTIVEELFG